MLSGTKPCDKVTVQQQPPAQKIHLTTTTNKKQLLAKYLEDFEKVCENSTDINNGNGCGDKLAEIDAMFTTFLEQIDKVTKMEQYAQLCPNLYLVQDTDAETGQQAQAVEKIPEVDKSTVVHDTEADLDDIFDEFQGTAQTKSATSNKCPRCKSEMIDNHQRGHMMCKECGMIGEQLIDRGPEWHQFNNDDGRKESVNRCTISTGATIAKIGKMRQWNSSPYKERSIVAVEKIIHQFCTEHGIRKIVADSANVFYRKIANSKHTKGENEGKIRIIRGNNRKSIIATCIYKACEQHKIPVSLKDIGKGFGLTDKKMSKGNKTFDEIIRQAAETDIFLEQLESISAEDYVTQLCPLLRLPPTHITVIGQMVRNCQRLKVASDHNAQALAACNVLFHIEKKNIDIDKKDVLTLFKTSDITMNKIRIKLMPYLRALDNDEATNYLMEKFSISS
jgi:transcription initiation factor TFIIIB Brf1 subunit/transcription initiation factor TFIIB